MSQRRIRRRSDTCASDAELFLTPPDDSDRYCPRFQGAIELIGRRWTGSVLMAMFRGASRFGEIRDAVPGLSDRLLTERLKELEDADVVRRLPEGRTVSYQLSPKGLALTPVVESLTAWVQDWETVNRTP